MNSANNILRSKSKKISGSEFKLYLLLICSLLLYSSTLAQNYDKLTQLNVNGQVDIDSNRVVVSKIGSATYVYHYAGSDWVPEQILNVSCAENAVDIHRDRIVIGNWKSGEGVCYIYTYKDRRWQQEAEISAPYPDEGFGYDVAIYGNIAIVGAPWHLEGSIYRGCVYIYHYNGSTWENTDIIYPTNSEQSYFGNTVEINRTSIIVGAPLYINSNSVWCGAAYLYSLNIANTADFEHLFVPSDGHDADEYGRGVDVEGDLVVVGSPFAKDSNGYEMGAMYFYSIIGSNWTEQIWTTSADNNVGQTVSIDKSLAITAGASNVYIYKYVKPQWTLAGTISNITNAFFAELSDNTIINSYGEGNVLTNIYELIARPGNVKATDGITSTTISWDNERSSKESSYNVYRNGNSLGPPAGSGSGDYTDPKYPVPGKIYSYSVASYNDTWGESNKVSDYGWQMPQGQISGKVTSQPPSTVPIPGISITAYCNNLRGSLDLTGNDTTDYAIYPGFSDFPQKALTVSFWMKSSDKIYAGTPISYAVDGSTNHFMIYNYNNFQIHLGGTATISTGISATDGLWNNIAVTWDSTTGQLNFYKNGESLYDTTMGIGYSHTKGGTLVLGQEQDQVGGGFDKNQSFVGYLAEIQVWDIKKTPTEIKEDMYRILHGNENGLVAYWRLHEGRGSIAGDYASYGGHHLNLFGKKWSQTEYAPVYYNDISDNNGNYYLTNIYYDSLEAPGAQFTVKPDTAGGRSFDPDETDDVYLEYSPTNPLDYQISSINFTDISAFSIRGQVQFDDLNYYLPGVELFVDNASVSATVTDASGKFAFPLGTGQHTLQPKLYDHTFVPAEMTFTVNSAIAGLVFKDTTHYTLSGKVGGGSDGYYLGEATILISGPDDCFNLPPLITVNGAYNIKLPAVPDILLTITEIDGQPVDEVFTSGRFKAGKTISMVKGDTTLDFIYYAEPRILITGLSDPTTIYNVPVLEQLEYAAINIKIAEDYGNERLSMADSGTISIVNNITNETTYKDIEIDESQYYPFLFRIGTPNILPGGSHPYQKRLYLSVEAKGGGVDTSIWVIVTGYCPREQTFATVSPAIPLLILRDPPGDHSYSYLEKSMTTSFTSSMSMLEDKSRNKYKSLKAGVAISIGYGTLWGSISQEIAAWLLGDHDMLVGASVLNQNEQQFTVTSTERFETSAEESDIGAESDVFVGAAFNIIYALADILEINDIGEVELSKSIIYGLDKEDAFATTYIYTQKYIEDILLPRFQENLSADTGPEGIQYWKDQIEAWRQIVALNDSLKMVANEPVGGQNSISISGGAAKYYSTTLEQSLSRTLEFNSYIDEQVAKEAGLELGGSGYKEGVQVRTRINIGQSVRTDTTIKQTVGYCIYDNESADNFWIDVKGDPVYGTPVFKLQEGCYTSRPWEKGTIPHEKCKLDIDGDYIQRDVDPAKDAVFTLELTNVSPSGQAGSYKLFLIPTSNPDGAQLQIFGDPISTISPFYLTAYQPTTIPLAVKLGPYAYDYEDLKLALRSVADEQIADTVIFSVHFTAPCSPIRIQEPEDGWVVSRSKNDSLEITLVDYDRNKMSTVMIQYRSKDNANWENASQFAAGLLPDNNAVIYWKTNGLAEGEYDLRTRVSWNEAAGYTYSNRVKGIIDRSAPVVFGKPQPADGVLNSGDNISVKFNENINQNALSTQNVTLLNARTGAVIPIDLVSDEREVIINPKSSLSDIENQNLQVSLINIQDQYGNESGTAIVWSFFVNQNPVYWNTSTISKTVLEGEGYNFWAKLSNDGGEDVFFNLSEIPWLAADPGSGWLNHGEEKIINFTMNPNTAAGFYYDTLFAEMSGGNEPLILDIHIQNKPPEWTLDPGSFNYDMTLTAGFYIDGVPFSEENDLVAAFTGDTLCGRVKVQKIVPQEEYIAFLMIHSNKIRGQNVRLVIWDASEGQERTITENLTFVADTSYGTAGDPDSLHISGALLQTIQLADNWSWFSLGVEARDMSTAAVLDRLRPVNGDLVKGHISYAQYLPGTGWVGDLDSLRIGNGFKIYLSTAKNLNYIGDPVADIHWPITVESGWNWIGFLPDETMNVNTALASLSTTVADGDQIKNKNSFASYNAAQSRWEGTLTEMKQGASYMIRLANSGVLNYPGPAGKRISLARVLSAKSFSASAPNWMVDAGTFEYSMNVTSKLTVDGLPVVDGKVILAAFVHDECRGISKPFFVNDKWIFFSTIFSNEAEDDSINFKVYDVLNDQIRDVGRKVPYAADKVIGTPVAPFALWVGIPTGLEEDSGIPRQFALEQNYPNPFNPVTTIRYALRQKEDVRLIIYDLLGRKVKVLVSEPQKAGWYDVQFNAKELASGIYIYRIKAGEFEKARKMVVIK